MRRKYSLIIYSVILIMAFYLQLPFIRAQNNTTSEIGFDDSTTIIYKNERFDLDDDNKRIENETRWNEIEILGISKSENQEDINVTWQKSYAVGVELADFEDNDSHWIFEYDYTSQIKANDNSSKYGILFNERDTLMSDAPESILLGAFRAFYSKELGFYESGVENQREKLNNVTKDEISTSITKATARTFEANINAKATVHLNSSYPTEPTAWYNITLDLKLFLVYGTTTNLLLSYNINYTITVLEWDDTNKIHSEYIQRQIIFWNVRLPTPLTIDYPLFEILEIPTVDFPQLPFILLGVVAIYISINVFMNIRGWKKNRREKAEIKENKEVKEIKELEVES